MSPLQIARDDEDIRCVSPQRLVPSSSPSRVIPFPSPVLSDAERLAALERHDPEGAAIIVRLIRSFYGMLGLP